MKEPLLRKPEILTNLRTSQNGDSKRPTSNGLFYAAIHKKPRFLGFLARADTQIMVGRVIGYYVKSEVQKS